jgi:hypothetical protein
MPDSPLSRRSGVLVLGRVVAVPAGRPYLSQFSHPNNIVTFTQSQIFPKIMSFFDPRIVQTSRNRFISSHL